MKRRILAIPTVGALAFNALPPVFAVTFGLLVVVASANGAALAGKRPSVLTVVVVGAGRVVSAPRGISCPPVCKKRFAADTRVALAAKPRGGSVFSRWGGACRGNGACLVRLNTARTVVAVFRTLPSATPPTSSPPPPPTTTTPPPSPTVQAGHYVGITSQNERISFDVSSDSRSLSNLYINDINQNCVGGGTTYQNRVDWRGFVASVGIDGGFSARFTDDVTYRDAGGNIFPATVTFSLQGKISGGSAGGSFRLDTSGSLNCSSGTVSWTAALTG